MVILQRQLFTLYPFLNVEGNASAPPSLPVPSEQPVAIDSCTPVMGFIPLSFSKGHSLLAAWWLPTPPVAHAVCIGVEALQLGCWLYHLLSGAPLNSFELFHWCFLLESYYFMSPQLTSKTSSLLQCSQHVSEQQAESPH